MHFKSTSIAAFDYVEAPLFMSSDELEGKLCAVYERLKLPFGRLELQTGIKSRGLWPTGTLPSTIAAAAGKKVLEKNNIKIQDVDLLIHASVCRDFLEPATASNVHRLLGMGAKTQIFDLSNACLGVMNAFLVAGAMIDAGVINSALIVSGENAGPLLEETIRFLNNNSELTRKSIKPFIANLTIGSAGVAFYLTNSNLAKGPILKVASVLTDSEANTLCQGSGDTHGLMMETHSEELLIAGINLAKKNFNQFLEMSSWKRESIETILCHQVGVAHRDLLYKNLELPIEKDFSTYPTFGNTGSAALPLTFCKAFEKGLMKQGERVAMLGIGSGLSSIMVGVEC
ncbi:MAG: 3-oxoacyl-ACP synthase III [Bacteriovoracaceae bacterium]